jgi:myosin-crossreactive antigen
MTHPCVGLVLGFGGVVGSALLAFEKMASCGGSGDAAAAASQGVVGAPGGLDRKIAEGVWKILKSIMAIRQRNALYLGAGVALG